MLQIKIPIILEFRKSNSAMAYNWNFGFSSGRPAKRKFEIINYEYWFFGPNHDKYISNF